MKSILASLMSVGMVTLASWQLTGQTPHTAEVVEQPPEIAASSADIAGTWFSLPTGLVLQFNADGTAQFGVDSDGTTLGYEAQTWFEGTRLFVKFVDNDGPSAACANEIGSYQVQVLETGNLKFVDAIDDCQLRIDALQGASGMDLALEYNPVG